MATVIRDLWPVEIKLQEVPSPEQILRKQAEYLTLGTHGHVKGVVGSERSNDRILIHLDLVSLEKSIRLISAQHQVDFPYPVLITPPDIKIPDFLKKQIWVEGVLDLPEPLRAVSTSGYVRNEWYCATPEEFITKVEKILASPDVKPIVLSLIAKSRDIYGDTPRA